MARTTPIDVADLQVDLKGRRVLDGVSFTLRDRGLVALAGPNGAGKSTLLRTIAGLIQPVSGTVLLAGSPLSALSAQARARTLTYVPQDRTVHWPLPVRAVVALGRLPHQGLAAPESELDRHAIAHALDLMDVAHLATRPILEVSGGEQARVLMARAFAQQPTVLLADEPASGLDPAHQWALFETLAKAANNGMRVIVAMHDLTLASRFAEHVIVLSDGKIAAEGAPTVALRSDVLAAIYGVTATTVDADGHTLIVPTGSL